MRARLVRVGWVALVLFACFPLLAAHAAKSKPKAEAPDPVQVASPEWPSAELTLGIQARDSETEGMGDILIPIWNPGGNGLLFINPRTAVTDSDEQEVNFGIGYRQLLPNQKIILGANAYYDYRDVGYGNYDQWGVGIEMLSSWIDARANYYNPEDKKLVVNTQTETTSRQSTRTSSSWSDVYPEDYGFYQDYVVTRTLTTETITRTFEQYQQALGGFDLELGTRLPLPAKSETIEAKVFGGYYDFDRDFGDDAQGWKARAEIRLLSSLFLDAGLYENDDLTGSDWFVGARFSVPLDLAAIAKGRNPFADVRSRLNREPRDFSARLTEMVQRDPQIRLETSKFIENKSLSSTTTQSQSSRQRLALSILPDVVFVDGDASGPGNGSAEHPFSTVQQGVDSAFGLRNVYVHAFSGPYNENVVLSPNTILLGSGYPIAGLGGMAYGGNSIPIVDGMNLGPSITMANNTRVSGFHIRNTGPSYEVYARGDFSDRTEPDLVSRVGIYAEGELGNLTLTHNLIEGCSYGARLEAEGNFSLRFENNIVSYNDRDGLRVSGYGSEDLLLGRGTPLPETTTFDVVLNNNIFSGNRGYGASIRATSYELATTGLINNEFFSNGRSGAYIGHRDSVLSMIYASGDSAFANHGSGISTIQYDNWVSLLNLSGLSSHHNADSGIHIQQDAEFLSAAVVGMPQGVSGLLSGLTGLPEELAGFFQPSGGVSASDNGSSGILAEISSDSLALGAFFDVAANRNEDCGVQALVDSEEGVAIALAGSSQNLSDLAQLGTDVLGALDVNLPISIPGNGQFQANDNSGCGLVLVTSAEDFALAGVLGAETSGNENDGTLLFSDSDNIAAALAARVVASDNGVNGLDLSVFGDDAAVGLLADVNASNNGENGIDATLTGDIAAFLTLSTDALRPLASYFGEQYLGEPYELPGASFGPVVANGNGNNGIYSLVAGEDTAISAFLDTHASQNGSFGFDVTTVATDGTAVSAFLSSDFLYDIAGEIYDLPEEIGLPGLGGIQANDNDLGGILSTTIGYDSASALFAGVQANNNGTLPDRRGDVLGDGIRAGLLSEDGSANAYFVGIEANENVGNGLFLNAESLFDVDAVALYVDANANLRDGLRLDVQSQSDDAFVLVAGTEATGNGDDGISVYANADDDASVGISDTIAVGNGDNGIYASVQGGNYADFFVGNLAVEDLDDIYDFVDDVGPLADLIPQGEVTASGNGLNGISADLVSGTGDATFVASETTADDNTANGIDFSLDSTAGTGDALVFLFATQTLGNDNTDINGSVESDAGDAIITGTNLVYSGYSLSATAGTGTADIIIDP